MNRVVLIGRLTAKPELRYTASNLPYTRFSLAVNRNYKNCDGEREADFINIVVWRKQAENVCNYLNKGNLVAIDGRIQVESYEDKNGNWHYTTNVIADSVEFLGSKKDGQVVQEVPHTEPQREINDPFAEFGDTVSIDDNFLD